MSDEPQWSRAFGWSGFPDDWHLCPECGSTRVNVESGSACPKGCLGTGIMPRHVPEELGGKPVRAKKKRRSGEVTKVMPGLLPCGGKGFSVGGKSKCTDTALYTIDGINCCWQCSFDRGVNPREFR